VLDSKTGADIATWHVGQHPTEMALARDGRLFVAEANFNTVSVIDTATGAVIETLTTSLFPNSPPGSMPSSLALSPDQKTLYVANADNNDIAAFDVVSAGHARSLGFIPSSWFPTSVRVSHDGKQLLIANGKGTNSREGSLEFVALPDAKNLEAQFGVWSQSAYASSPLNESLLPRGQRNADNPVPAKLGDASPIKHVIYVVRENRTYDQILGDLGEGNGDAKLAIFGENVTPNAHELAREFVLLDNFYANAEVSADGHEWTMGAQATDFVEKMWPLNYGHDRSRKNDYPSEGRWPVAYPANGYLWNRASEAGVSFRSYGEFCHTPKRPHNSEVSEATLPILKGHIDPYYKAWDLGYSDELRAARFAQELKRFEREGDMPQLQVVRLGGDHTEGATAGKLTPTAHMAENDAALGELVDAVSHSKFWADTAIFVLEDDSQDGTDHVDAHRMPAFVISPWTRRHAVDSTLYSTTSMLRTIELILGLQPMSQFDAVAMPLYNSFTDKPDMSPFTALAPRVDIHATNTKLAYGAKESAHWDFSEPDRVDDAKLNEVVWRSVRGADSPMPPPVRAAFLKLHPKNDDDDD
jgi:YVTN family beta-propeller protein